MLFRLLDTASSILIDIEPLQQVNAEIGFIYFLCLIRVLPRNVDCWGHPD